MASSFIGEYAREIDKLDNGGATEFTFRTALQNLLRAMAKEHKKECGDLEVLHEPPRKSGIGAPDFLIYNIKSGAAVGYIECKKPGESLDAISKSEQLEKYKTLSPNILLTDYRHFWLLKDGGKEYKKTELGKTAASHAEVVKLITQFLSVDAQEIGDAKILAQRLATQCAFLREGLEEKLPDDDTSLHGLFKAFKEVIYRDIDIAQFADALAQTLVYGLLLAKLKASSKNRIEVKLDLWNIEQHIPQNFSLVREITGFLNKLDDTPHYEDIKYLVGNILAIINAINVDAINKSMFYKQGKLDEQDNFYLYFYETFLAAYDSKMRQARGVYYTPPPVVRFIVRATDDILRRDFALSDGLADNTVTALDFATGTGTFLLEMIRLVFGNKDTAKRYSIAHEHLLKNFFGFEYLIAPYTIAHLKLSQFLMSEGVSLKEDERINVFLTNTLEEAKEIDFPLLKALTEEVKRAKEIKKQSILIITGNPPYSGESQNKSGWISGLIKDYKQVDGKPLGEKNSKWLQDDYVKFIRFAQWKIAKEKQGIVAIITNHAFMDNPTFRGMRQSLLNTFDRLYFLDLHGNSKKKERTPEGGKDENVFDIQQGVAISLLVKNAELSKGVFHADFWGRRENKYKLCAEQDIENVAWKEIKPVSPFYLFIPRNEKMATVWENNWSVKDIFVILGTGIITKRDKLAIQFSPDKAMESAKDILVMPEKEFREKYKLPDDVRDWQYPWAKADVQKAGLSESLLHPIHYRPFDTRYLFYTGKSRGFIGWPVDRIMRHILRASDNIALITIRQAQVLGQDEFSAVFVSDKIVDININRRGGGLVLPLYRDDSEMGKTSRTENFKPEFRKWIDKHYGKQHTPEDILGCIYTIMHSPDYRRRYAEFLRLDFPRIPFPKDNAEFMRLAKIGNALIAAHLLRENCTGDIELRGSGTTLIADKIRYDETEQRLYFNADEYLSPISSEVFNFQIGGYRPLEKFLKSRKGRNISPDIRTLEKAANAIAFTLTQMQKIDQ